MTKEELRRDMLEDDYRDYQQETRLRRDLDYALEHLGAQELVTQLEDLSAQLSKLGYELTAKELIEYLL